jgi:hypothetical protein
MLDKQINGGEIIEGVHLRNMRQIVAYPLRIQLLSAILGLESAGFFEK